MKITDLRIGNYVNTSERDGRHFQICRQGLIRTINNASCNITPQGCSSPVITIKLKNIEPIPLTEEWFLKFGKIEWLSHDINGYFYWFNKEKKYIKFVHILQNTYFCIEQKELKYETNR